MFVECYDDQASSRIGFEHNPCKLTGQHSRRSQYSGHPISLPFSLCFLTHSVLGLMVWDSNYHYGNCVPAGAVQLGLRGIACVMKSAVGRYPPLQHPNDKAHPSPCYCPYIQPDHISLRYIYAPLIGYLQSSCTLGLFRIEQHENKWVNHP